MSIQKFHISISPFVIDDLRERLGRARWPDEIEDSGWAYGTNKEYLYELCTHWGHGFDWYEQQDYLNTFSHFRADIGGFGIHFIHHKGKGRRTTPILLTHGYPDCFIRFLKVIPLLTAAGFDVVVPSIPGFGFSDRPKQPGMNPELVADLFAQLMTDELGYRQFIAHGGDWGSSIAEQLAVHHPEALLGIHLTDVPYHHLFTMKAEDLSEAEKKYMQAGQQWQMTEGGYAILQSTKPQTLAYAVNDSPIGLASWIIEKFYAWSDTKGQLENSFTKNELLTNLTIYWVTQTAGSAFRMYYEAMRDMLKNKGAGSRISIPTAVAIFPKDMVPAPKEYAERIFNIQQWTNMPEGGHFAAMERPILLADDIMQFAKKLGIPAQVELQT
ncbi:epoxide hydrolase [Flavitalea sp. BT771]|uniref:epoxide hydrolase family protein n=1 Tax=Flavitalea sp. BT771 TaxID=3063329 RepID=UPI0026E3A918|nr:epoxide hydrolase family protein [Flavitalea sp. BT771]MDO6434038.1 epoxide hydrolase [Flavitalea sp. BT771]MDV6222938.1 epoxide hydrolase [Flavitalea sp. BT771]